MKNFVPTLQYIYYRFDCCDFDISIILRMLYLYGNTGLLTDEILDELKQVILDFDYWFSLNTKFPGMKNFWTENHIMVHHSSEYLAAFLYPDEMFRSRGMKGADILPIARAKVADWISVKMKSGFCEWDSNTYMAVNMASLFNIYDFSGDSAMKAAAKDLLDLITFGVSVNSYKGIYCCSHGRGYSDEIKNGNFEEMRSIIKMLWNIGEHGERFFQVAFISSCYMWL